MQKNKKNGFLFFDLLVALMMALIFVTIVFSVLCFLTSRYTIHKEYIFAENIISEALYKIDIGDQLSSKSINKLDQTDFVLTVDREIMLHTPFEGVDRVELIILAVSWVGCRNTTETIKVKTLDKVKLFAQL